MQPTIKTLLCFKRPPEGAYVGGFVTLCNDYIDKQSLFVTNGVSISCFNYELPTDGFIGKIKNSKIQNIVYGLSQIQALKQKLIYEPNTCIHIHTSRKALFFKDVILADSIRGLCKGRILMTVHVGDIDTVFHNSMTRRFLIGKLNKSVDKVLFLSERMRQQFIAAGLEENRSAVLYNFYNIKAIAPFEKIPNKTVRLLYLGSINREKGIIELLSALNNSRNDFHIDICGSIIEPAITPLFTALLHQLGNKAIWHGYVDKAKKSELLRFADILVLPSYREGLPISIIEAMATSCGVIATPVGAIPEILTEENSIFVAPRDINGLQKAIDRLIENPDLLDTMKESNFRKSRQFKDSIHINKLCEFYRQ